MKKLLATLLLALTFAMPLSAGAVYYPFQGGTGAITLSGLIVGHGGGTNPFTGLVGNTYGQMLVWNGSEWGLVSTTSLGIISGGVWGSVTGTLSDQTDLQSALDAKLALSAWYATTTDGLDEGSTNLYFTNGRAISALAGLYEVPLTFSYPLVRTVNAISTAFGTTTTNIFSNLQTFTNGFISLASSTAQFLSIGNSTTTNATTTNLYADKAGVGTTTMNARLSVQATSTLGSEMITNGSFTGGTTGWTLGDCWTYSANVIYGRIDGVCVGQNATQTATLATGLYRVSFDYFATTSSVSFYIITQNGNDSIVSFDGVMATTTYTTDVYVYNSSVDIGVAIGGSTGDLVSFDNFSVKTITVPPAIRGYGYTGLESFRFGDITGIGDVFTLFDDGNILFTSNYDSGDEEYHDIHSADVSTTSTNSIYSDNIQVYTGNATQYTNGYARSGTIGIFGGSASTTQGVGGSISIEAGDVYTDWAGKYINGSNLWLGRGYMDTAGAVEAGGWYIESGGFDWGGVVSQNVNPVIRCGDQYYSSSTDANSGAYCVFNSGGIIINGTTTQGAFLQMNMPSFNTDETIKAGQFSLGDGYVDAGLSNTLLGAILSCTDSEYSSSTHVAFGGQCTLRSGSYGGSDINSAGGDMTIEAGYGDGGGTLSLGGGSSVTSDGGGTNIYAGSSDGLGGTANITAGDGATDGEVWLGEPDDLDVLAITGTGNTEIRGGSFKSLVSGVLNYFTAKLGVGSTTPWGMLSVVQDDSSPEFVVATSTGQRPLFYVNATTTGALAGNWGARIGVGLSNLGEVANGVLGAHELIDNFTIDSPINTMSWTCSELSSAGHTSLSADGSVTSSNGSWTFNEDANMALDFNGSNFELRGGAVSLNDGAQLALQMSGTSDWLTFSASSTPTFEGISQINSLATGTNHYLGFNTIDGNSTSLETPPTVGCNFIATTTQSNWRAVCQTSASAMTSVDTGISTTTDRAFYWKIKASEQVVQFYMGDRVTPLAMVARITTNVPAVTTLLSPQLLIGYVTSTDTLNTQRREIKSSYIRACWRNNPFLNQM